MAVLTPEERLRYKRSHSEKAIQLAMQSRWSEAIGVNRGLIEHFPDDVDAHNRLGKALLETGQYADARAAYRTAAKLDPTNTIAAKNLVRLEKLVTDSPAAAVHHGSAVDPKLFIEESGKTAVTDLVDVPRFETIANLVAGERLEIRVNGGLVRLTTAEGVVVGQVEPKLSKRLLRLIEIGNKFSAAITSIDEAHVRVILRETFRHSSMGSRPSFPTQAPTDIRSYTRDSVFRDFDDDDDDDMVEELETELEASDTVIDEPTLSDDGELLDDRLPLNRN